MKSEIAAGTRGSSLGSEALKIASLNKRSDFFDKYKISAVPDCNQLLWAEINTPYAIRIEGLVEIYKSLSKSVAFIINSDCFPLVLSADHGSAGGTIAGIKAAYPKKRLGVIWIDAHGDLHSPYTSPSGNMHGMPLATALGYDNKDQQINQITDITLKKWEELKNIGNIQPKLLPDDLIFFGVRDTETPENYIIDKFNIKNYTVAESRKNGLKNVATDALERLSDCDILYVSFDVDAMDPDVVSYGTGTPVKNGYLPSEVQDLLNTLVVDKRLVAFEMVEINPTLDNKGNKMAETAFDILEKTSELIEKNER